MAVLKRGQCWDQVDLSCSMKTNALCETLGILPVFMPMNLADSVRLAEKVLDGWKKYCIVLKREKGNCTTLTY